MSRVLAIGVLLLGIGLCLSGVAAVVHEWTSYVAVTRPISAGWDELVARRKANHD